MEEALENKPILKETIGGILGIFIPLHIRLKDIDSVHMNETGKVTINLPYRRHITIQLESKHAEEFVNRLNQLKQKAKDREIKEHVMQKRAKRKTKKKQRSSSELLCNSSILFPHGTSRYCQQA